MTNYNDDTDRYQLKPDKFPRRLDLEVSEEVLDKLQRISKRTGRSISEIAAAIIVQGAEKIDPEQFDLYVEILMRSWFSALM